MTTAESIFAGVGALIIIVVLWKTLRRGMPSPNDGMTYGEGGDASGSFHD